MVLGWGGNRFYIMGTEIRCWTCRKDLIRSEISCEEKTVLFVLAVLAVKVRAANDLQRLIEKALNLQSGIKCACVSMSVIVPWPRVETNSSVCIRKED